MNVFSGKRSCKEVYRYANSRKMSFASMLRSRMVFLLVAMAFIMLMPQIVVASECISSVSIKGYMAPGIKGYESLEERRFWRLFSGKTVSEAFASFKNGRGVGRYFYKYARYIEEALLISVRRKYCEREEEQGIAVEMEFIWLPFLVKSRKELELIRNRLKEVKGSYADISVDNRQKKVKAVFVWNPRRMWRDILVSQGWNLFEHKKIILPFLVSDVRKYCSYYKKIESFFIN